LTMKNRQTLIMVTHDLNIAKRADRIIYILDGRIEGIEENQYAGLRMSKIKIVNILILLVLLISFNLETVNVFAGPNDIIITKVVQKEENVSAGKSFKLEVYYKNVLGVPLKDVYISVDKSSSFILIMIIIKPST